MGPVLPIFRRTIYQPEIGFVYQRGGLQSMVAAFRSKVVPRDAAKIVEDQFHETRFGIDIVSVKLCEKGRNFRARITGLWRTHDH